MNDVGTLDRGRTVASQLRPGSPRSESVEGVRIRVRLGPHYDVLFGSNQSSGKAARPRGPTNTYLSENLLKTAIIVIDIAEKSVDFSDFY